MSCKGDSMAKYSKEELEFEQNKAAILGFRDEKKKQHSVWDFEIEAHRKRKKMDRFLMFGAFCGILSLIGTLFIIYQIKI